MTSTSSFVGHNGLLVDSRQSHYDRLDQAECLYRHRFYHEVPERVKMDQLATKSFNQRHPNIYRGYFPLVPGQLSHKQGYDLGPVIKPGDVLPGEEGNPFTEETPRLRLPDKCKEVERFYEVCRNRGRQTFPSYCSRFDNKAYSGLRLCTFTAT